MRDIAELYRRLYDKKSKRASSVVVLSGGQDSVTTLLLARQFTDVKAAVHFTYDQKHAIEQESARWWCEQFDIPFLVRSAEGLAQIGHSGLIGEGGSVTEQHPDFAHLPASFVPGRNLVFLTLAAAQAMKLGATEVWTGVCQTDYSGYPDCRQSTIWALQDALARGMDFHDLHIVTPLMHATKAETFFAAKQLGRLEDVLERTHTCYKGDRTIRHEWGYGCGTCPACEVRARGWREYNEEANGSSKWTS